MSAWESELNEPSRRLLSALQQRTALLDIASLRIEPDLYGSKSIVVDIPSPTGDPHRHLGLWLDENRVPSVEFGAWHEHADRLNSDEDSEAGKLLAFAERIIAGRILLDTQRDEDGWPCSIIDLDDGGGVGEAVTHTGCAEAQHLMSWSGQDDQAIGVRDSRRP